MATLSIGGPARARIRLAMANAARQCLFDPNVALIDFGFPERGGRLDDSDVAIRVHVRRKLAGDALEAAERAGQTWRIPATIDGFRTDVPVGRYRLHFLMPPTAGGGVFRRPLGTVVASRARRAQPLRGGVSIAEAAHRIFGTLGGLVWDRRSGDPMLLSNWHVFVNNWSAVAGLPIVQPGRLDGGTLVDTVAHYQRDAMAVRLDAAVAVLDGNRDAVNDQFGLGPVRGLGVAELGMRVVKSGRASGVTTGRVTAIEGAARLPYAGLERLIVRVMTIEPDLDGQQVSTGGDSGSLWLDAETRRAVGLHFAGSDRPERALAMDLAPVLDALGVTLATTGA